MFFWGGVGGKRDGREGEHQSLSPRTSNPNEAGLGVNFQAKELLSEWVLPLFIDESSLSLTFDLVVPVTIFGLPIPSFSPNLLNAQNRGVGNEKKNAWTLSREDEFGFEAFYWGDRPLFYS